MAAPRKKTEGSSSRRRPATTPEARENQMIALAVDLAEKQMREGNASAQVITHYLKLAGPKEKLEQEKLRNENELLKARVKNIESMANMEGLYKEAMQAMTEYKGLGNHDDPDV